jgi:hypothetical protein
MQTARQMGVFGRDPLSVTFYGVFMIVLIDPPDTPEVAASVEEFLREGNRYLGAKFLHLGPELQVHADLPCAGLNTPLLLAVMRRLLAVVEDAAYDMVGLEGVASAFDALPSRTSTPRS